LVAVPLRARSPLRRRRFRRKPLLRPPTLTLPEDLERLPQLERGSVGGGQVRGGVSRGGGPRRAV